jgi:hypothetical protein
MTNDQAQGVWHVAHSDTIRQLLHQVADGEDPELAYLEFYANSIHHQDVDDPDLRQLLEGDSDDQC